MTVARPLPPVLVSSALAPAVPGSPGAVDAVATDPAAAALLCAAPVSAETMVTSRLSDSPPPGAGESTVTCTTSGTDATARSDAGISAVSVNRSTIVVSRADPFQSTLTPGTKPAPVSVSVNGPPPRVTTPGSMDRMRGSGLTMVNVSAVEVPPPGDGVNTVTSAVPCAAMSVSAIAACSCVLLMTMVGRS